MALDFSSYLNVEVESVEAPLPVPIGHYYATIKSWKGQERDYDKANGGPKTPVIELTFSLTAPDDDVDEELLPAGGVQGKVVTRDYSLNDADKMGIFMLRKLAEETCDLPVTGLSLGDLLPTLIGQDVKVYIDHRPGKEEGQFFPQVKKVLSVNG